MDFTFAPSRPSSHGGNRKPKVMGIRRRGPGQVMRSEGGELVNGISTLRKGQKASSLPLCYGKTSRLSATSSQTPSLQHREREMFCC